MYKVFYTSAINVQAFSEINSRIIHLSYSVIIFHLSKDASILKLYNLLENNQDQLIYKKICDADCSFLKNF